jgi:sugar/nucleoside kinase (ribokinase family)
VAELLPWVDVFLPNEPEALAITGAGDVFTAGRQLALRGPLVVIKRGAKGALAFQDGREWEQPPAAPPAIVDTVGAGDNFDAGFLRGWLLGWAMPDCLQLADRCAAASLGRGGGISGQIQGIRE